MLPYTCTVDTDNAFDDSSGIFTVPSGKAGKYRLTFTARYVTTAVKKVIGKMLTFLWSASWYNSRNSRKIISIKISFPFPPQKEKIYTKVKEGHWYMRVSMIG